MKNNILESIQENYNNIGKFRNYKLINAQNINSINYLINTSKQKFALRTFGNNSQINKMEKICEIMDFCVTNNAKVYRPIKTTDGTFVIPGEKAFLTEFYTGTHFSGSEKEIISVAKALAKLHKTLEAVKIQYNFRTNQSYYKIITDAEIKKIIGLLKKKTDPIDIKINKKMPYIIERIQNISKKTTDSKIKHHLIHHDLHPGNIIFQNKNVNVIIDFNSMRKGYRIEDVGFAGFRFAEQHSTTKDMIKNKLNLFCNTYNKENELSSKELGNLSVLLEKKFLGRISYILRKRYFRNDNSWIVDFDKNINFLKIIQGLFK